jgi:flavin reductase (DIM6/NTAB) family NADH-FMN oxidoreductase RutF
MDPKLLSSVMGQFSTGVTVVSFTADGEPEGMTANSFMSVSVEPPLILISVRNNSRFNQSVREGMCYGINFLTESQSMLTSPFHGRTERRTDLTYTDHRGTPLLDGSLVQLVARTVDVHPAGDHLLYIGEVEHLRLGERRDPLMSSGGRHYSMQARLPSAEQSGRIDCW